MIIFLSYIVELVILLLVNFILEKSFTYCTNVLSYFEKGNKYTYLHINLNVLRKFTILCWATLIAVLGRIRHGLDGPGLNRMGLTKDMRNDNLFFERVTDLIIPDYPLFIYWHVRTCKDLKDKCWQVLVPERNYQLIGIVLENPNSLY